MHDDGVDADEDGALSAPDSSGDNGGITAFFDALPQSQWAAPKHFTFKNASYVATSKLVAGKRQFKKLAQMTSTDHELHTPSCA